jgi:hypothetical protein
LTGHRALLDTRAITLVVRYLDAFGSWLPFGGGAMTLLSFLGLALADAMNPFSIAAMVFLLATDRPFARGGVFILGTLAVCFPFGVALVEGWTALLANLIPQLPSAVKSGLLILGGIACAGAAWWIISQGGRSGPSNRVSDRLSLPATAAFAIGSALADAPTAVPLFAAAAQIPTLAAGRLGQYAWLALYCLIYVAPLVLLLGIRLRLGEKAAPALRIVKSGVEWGFRYVLPPLLVVVGLWLVWIGVELLP